MSDGQVVVITGTNSPGFGTFPQTGEATATDNDSFENTKNLGRSDLLPLLLGHYLVEEALKAGLRVIATARNLESIKDLEKLGATIFELDLNAPEAIINDFAQKAISVQ